MSLNDRGMGIARSNGGSAAGLTPSELARLVVMRQRFQQALKSQPPLQNRLYTDQRDAGSANAARAALLSALSGAHPAPPQPPQQMNPVILALVHRLLGAGQQPVPVRPQIPSQPAPVLPPGMGGTDRGPAALPDGINPGLLAWLTLQNFYGSGDAPVRGSSIPSAY